MRQPQMPKETVQRLRTVIRKVKLLMARRIADATAEPQPKASPQPSGGKAAK